MLNAGIKIDMEVIKRANDVRENKADFVVFKIKNQKCIELVHSFPQTEEDIKSFNNDNDKYFNWISRVYPNFLTILDQQSEPMFVVLDFKYEVESRKCSKLYFIGWCPEKTTVKNKMLFSTTFAHLANTLNVQKRITAHTKNDIEYDELYRHIH